MKYSRSLVMFIVVALLVLGTSLAARSSTLHAENVAPASSAQNLQAPRTFLDADERYKADILVVVAHPDDEAAVTPYLARAIDEGKRVAVIYGTRGGSGANQAGAEHAAALADIREIEARKACATLGITNVWFLGGRDTASQNVLQSLATWGHGATLEEMVRLVRLTRPEVMLTFFPGVFIGENHGDHQASGVLATEAFDLAGDAAVFASQVAGPTRRLEPYLENLRPWQPKKIYYFETGTEKFKDSGPSYAVTEISKSRHIPYWRVALESFKAHETQEKKYIDSLGTMSEQDLEKQATDAWGSEQTFVLGKSLVGGSVTGDIFENISASPAVPAPRVLPSASVPMQVSIELGGPWSFYRDFRLAHGLEQLPKLDIPEIAIAAGGTLEIPVWLQNPTNAVQEIKLNVTVPDGWTVNNGADLYSVRPGKDDAATIEIAVPQLPASETTSKDTNEVSVTGESKGQNIGTIKLRVQLRSHSLPQ
ncbi:MAG: PIG-L family deacetylase [Candidatus Acidiferrales bacterium]